jgi:hypothetical protein
MNHRIARFVVLAAIAGAIMAQTVTPGGPQPAGKNIKELPWGVSTQKIMKSFTAALGVQCTYCHVQGDFASDANPKKDIARGMIRMMRDANYHFPDVRLHVTCYECHRGETTPKTAPAK